MKLSTSKFERSATARFVPSDWEKSVVRVKWCNCDRYAMNSVEGQYHAVEWPLIDRHGYPAS